MGQAASAAAVLLAAGAPGQRSVLRHAKVLLHQPSSQARGTLPDLAVQAKEVAKVRAEMDEILSRHTGHPVAKIRSDTDRNMTFTAREAVAYGLADQVITTRRRTASSRPDHAASMATRPAGQVIRAADRAALGAGGVAAARIAASRTTEARPARPPNRSRPTSTSRSDSSMSSASQMAARTSEEPSFRPRSTSDR